MNDSQVVDCVCQVLEKAGRSMTAREIAGQLKSKGIDLQKERLNSILWAKPNRRPGLEVDKHFRWTWSARLSAPPHSTRPGPQTPAPSAPLKQGNVDRYIGPKGYGFIRGDDGFSYFAHASYVIGGPLHKGQRVEFESSNEPKGLAARKVRPVGPAVQETVPPKPSSQPAVERLALRNTSVTIKPPRVARPLPTQPPASHPNVPIGKTLGVLIGLSTGSPSFALGNRLVRSPAFQFAVNELLDAAEGREPKEELPILAAELVSVLREHGITKDPALAVRLAAAVDLLSPFFRLVAPQSRPEIHRAMLEHVRRSVRDKLAGSAETAPEPVPSATPPAQLAVPKAAIPQEEQAPPAVATASSSTSPSTGLLEHVEHLRRQTVTSATKQMRELLSKLETAFQNFSEAPLDFGRASTIAIRLREFSGCIGELTESVAASLSVASPESATQHREALRFVDDALGHPRPNDLPAPTIGALLASKGAERVSRLASAALLTKDIVPEWLLVRWFRDASAPLARLSAMGVDSPLSTEAVDFVQWLETLPKTSTTLLPRCPPPNGNEVLLEHIQRELDRLLEVERDAGQRQARIASLAAFISKQFASELSLSRDVQADALLERTESLVRRLKAAERSLSAAAFATLSETMSSWPASEAVLDRLQTVEAAIELLGDELSRSQPTLDALTRIAEKVRNANTAVGEPKPGNVERVAQAVALSHPLSRSRGGKTSHYSAEVAWVPAADQPFGVVRFPVRLKFDPPNDRATEWLVDVSTDLLEAVPEEWRRLFPTSMPQEVGAGVMHKDVVIEIPMSRGTADLVAAERRTMSLTISASRGLSKASSTLQWQGLRRDLPAYQSPFSGTVSKKEMESQPLGVEREFTRLRDLIQQGRKSFRIHGPRRMGKTTLLRALQEHFRTSKEVCLLTPAVVASEHSTANAVWTDVGKRLSARFDRPVSIGADMVPAEGAFDSVRARARSDGYSAIYVLIDEAQALFSTAGESNRMGEALKARLELDWGLNDASRVPLLIGLVGQAHLPDLMGGNLKGAISDSFTTESIHADELLPLLRANSELGLQSTLEAREALARQSGNLWILDRLLTRVAMSCREKGRPWFIEDDVEAGVQRLIEADQSRTETTLWSYVRDVLNDSDDKDIWRPSETYPVALAWALARSLDARVAAAKRAQKIDHMREIIKDWAEDIEIKNNRIDEAFARLQQQRVLRRDDSFDLPVLERLLAARAMEADPFGDEIDRRTLGRLGLNRIATPGRRNANEKSGGQADVYEGALPDGRRVAVRRVRLSDATAERRFIREVALLERLGDATGEIELKAQPYLPKLVSTGIDPAAPDIGVVVYDWIDGTSLEDAELSADGALATVRGLSRALAGLAHAGVVHRDIRPANVLVRQGQWEPVLIDFGLSVAVEAIPSSTILGGVIEFLPPEVKERGASAWVPEGDMYSLGRAVDTRLSETARADREVVALLTRMTAKDSSKRPNAVALIAEVEALLEKRRFDARTKAVQSEFSGAISSMPAYLRHAVSAAAGDYVAARAGMISSRNRVAQVAEFLENLVQAKIRTDHPGTVAALRQTKFNTYLRGLAEIADLPPPLKDLAGIPELNAVGILRNAAAHPTELDRLVRDAYRELPGSLTGNRAYDGTAVRSLETAVHRVAVQIGRLLSHTELEKLVQRWFAA